MKLADALTTPSPELSKSHAAYRAIMLKEGPLVEADNKKLVALARELGITPEQSAAHEQAIIRWQQLVKCPRWTPELTAKHQAIIQSIKTPEYETLCILADVGKDKDADKKANEIHRAWKRAKRDRERYRQDESMLIEVV